MDIVPTNVGGAAIAVQPLHPHGELLLADYLFGARRPNGPGKIRIWQRVEKPGLQTLTPGPWDSDGKIRKGARTLRKASKEISRRGGQF